MNLGDINISVSDMWLIAAAILFAADVFLAGGIGLIFAGLAALVTAIALQLSLIEDDQILLQFALWLGLTTVFGAILWKPLKKWRLNPNLKNNVSNMTGDLVEICDGNIEKGKIGRAKWSGTTMHAEIYEQSETKVIKEGELAEIIEVRGATVIVAPRGEIKEEKIEQ